MQRRELLGALALSVAGMAGCSSSDGESPPTVGDAPTDRSTPASPIYPFNAGPARDFEFEESEDGTALIHVPVENTRDEPYAGTLSLTVTVDGEQRTLSRPLRLDGGERATVPVEVDAEWSEWTPNFRNVTFSQGTPAG
jgi:hypothetical protein